MVKPKKHRDDPHETTDSRESKTRSLERIPSQEIDENDLFEHISEIIDNRKRRAYARVNQEVTMMFWEIGHVINSFVLENKRADYGKKIVSALATQLEKTYGGNFSKRNLYRMMQFAEFFSDPEIVSPLATQLSWSHFIELLPLKTHEARLYYANDAFVRNYGAKELRRQISRKAYERKEIANTEISEQSAIPFNVFKDPYILDTFDLKENYHEADLEKAILTGLESFILEFGNGFTFVERQKRMIIDGEDIVLDLLFYNRKHKRLVAIEVKMGRFKPEYMGQMMLYLKWLNRYERKEGEEQPIGLILCTSANRKKVEMLEMDKAGIAVAEYWTDLPPKEELERKIEEIAFEAKERLERRKKMPHSDIPKEIDYFFESKDDDE